MHTHTSRELLSLAGFALLVTASALQAQQQVDPLGSITDAELRDHIHYLASDFLEGRNAGEKGYKLAALYGAIVFDAAGLVPMFSDSSGAPTFFQQIELESAKLSGASAMQANAEFAYSSPNVVGLLPGTDPVLTDEYVVVTAHLDHLGMRNGVIFNGADDNASGSAAVLEAAEAAAMAPAKRSIIFVLFTAEEKGFLGSTYFVDNPPVPIEAIVLNINLDMVGRNSPDWPESLLALASEKRRPELLELIRDVNSRVRANLDWRLNEGEDPHGHVQRSDQLAFMQKGIPAILITRGFMGPDYHQPSDDPETINYPKVTQAARLAYALAVAAANSEVLFVRE
ncbi:MAG: M28 family peptidase [Gemmatimonadota bacterium]|nr:MAG: M28 family peptidase [Gemmatimonadota bacterium]